MKHNLPTNDDRPVFFDSRFVRTDYHDGISRYSAELANALYKQLPVTFLICDPNQKKWLPKDAKTLLIHAPTSAKEPFTALLLNRYHPAVVYCPMQTIGSFGKKFKLVLTIHDLIYYRHHLPPQYLTLPLRAGWRLYHASYWPQRLALTAADSVTAVSKTTVADMLKTHMVRRPPAIVYNAPQRFDASKVKHGTEPIKNIIYMGSFMPYKNVETLIMGLAWLPGRSLHLLSRLSAKRKAELQAIIPNNAQVIFHNGVTDKRYEALLADNALLTTASLDEGYGIPVAEAMQMGVPVVISDIPVFREVGGTGAVYFNPHSPQQFAEAVKKLDDPEVRQKHIDKALEHITQFDWNKSATVLREVIETLQK